MWNRRKKGAALCPGNGRRKGTALCLGICLAASLLIGCQNQEKEAPRDQEKEAPKGQEDTAGTSEEALFVPAGDGVLAVEKKELVQVKADASGTPEKITVQTTLKNSGFGGEIADWRN